MRKVWTLALTRANGSQISPTPSLAVALHNLFNVSAGHMRKTAASTSIGDERSHAFSGVAPLFARARFPFIATAVAAGLAACGIAAPAAYAQTMDDLQYNYQAAIVSYEDALQAQQASEKELEQTEEQIQVVEQELSEEEAVLQDTTVSMYKSFPGRGKLIDMLLDSQSLSDALTCFDDYQRIQRYYLESIESYREKRDNLSQLQDNLQQERQALADNVTRARANVYEAERAIEQADHSDGLFMHQRQGNDSNCGTTAFIVGVNILLHHNFFTDNVAEWSGVGFNGDSTVDLGSKGALWLAANGLSDYISVETVPGDIHTADELQAELEQGHVVVISSGPGSVWCYADGSAVPGLFPYGHWIVFYQYENGVFYANDSSTDATRGAGCPYSRDDMQRWLDGRSNHFAVSLALR